MVNLTIPGVPRQEESVATILLTYFAIAVYAPGQFS